MGIVDALDDVLMWIGRMARVLPAFQAVWQAVEAKDADQELVAAMEFARAVRREQARQEILNVIDDPGETAHTD